MKRYIVGAVAVLIVLLTFKYCSDKNAERIVLKESSALIEKQLKNVSKLVVTEGHYSEVFTYKNSKVKFGNLIKFDKKALVVVNANVTVSYDLSQIQYELDESSKTLRILSIPKEEININPDFEYYDVTADFLNPFEAEDYNKIKETVKRQLMKKVEASNLKSNAQNRLISELSKFYILTNSLGWTLEYKGNFVNSSEEFQKLENFKS
jgi:hypothetical protein